MPSDLSLTIEESPGLLGSQPLSGAEDFTVTPPEREGPGDAFRRRHRQEALAILGFQVVGQAAHLETIIAWAAESVYLACETARSRARVRTRSRDNSRECRTTRSLGRGDRIGAAPNLVILAGPNGAGKSTIGPRYFVVCRPLATTWRLYENSSSKAPRLVAQGGAQTTRVVDGEIWQRIERGP